MDDAGCLVGQKIGDAEFVSIFFPSFQKLSEKEKWVAIDVTKALVEKSRKLKTVDAQSVATFYPNFTKLDEKDKEVAIEVSKALIDKMRKEGRKKTKRKGKR
jgi:ERCC4-related helicase